MRNLLAGVLLVTAGTAGADAVADGQAIAEAWCSECHAVGPTDTVTDAAPSFASIGALPTTADEWLRQWIMNPHPPMPRLDLTDRDIEVLLIYMRSLAEG